MSARVSQAIVVLAVVIGIFARVSEFGDLPPGLNQDEASTGVDAFSLLRFGIDRNGIAFPVQFIAWGSGQNALYAYATIPMLAIAGLSPLAVRLPMLISGLLTLPLMYFVARRTFGAAAAAIATFLLAISPWHIVLSRWGLESNLLPFVFMLAYACLLASSTRNLWFVVSCGTFAIALYAYGTAYAAVPLFLLVAVPILWRANRLTHGTVLLGGAVFVVVATPIVVFLLINALRENTGVQLGPLTAPLLPTEARYETLSALSSSSPASAFIMNSRALLVLLVRQTDDLAWNTVPQFGYFYRVTFPIALIGAVQLLAAYRKRRLPEHALLLVWLGVGLVIGMLQPVNINRLNILFVPLLLLMALPIVWLAEWSRIALGAAVGALLVGFAAFTFVYHGPQFRRQLDAAFFTGLMPALEFAGRAAPNLSVPICVTGQPNMPYIFVLFVDPADPRAYLPSIVYSNPRAPIRSVEKLGRYSFGIQNCPEDAHAVYVLHAGEAPRGGEIYETTTFDSYTVYRPAVS